MSCPTCGHVEVITAKDSGLEQTYDFTYDELKALSRALERQYLPYDDEELHAVVNKVFKILKESQ